MAYMFPVVPTPENSSVAAINAARGYAGTSDGTTPSRAQAISGENWQRNAPGHYDAALSATRFPPASFIPEFS